jgi:hypothetical protein
VAWNKPFVESAGQTVVVEVVFERADDVGRRVRSRAIDRIVVRVRPDVLALLRSIERPSLRMNAPTELETVLLQSASSRVLVAPERGAIVTRFLVEDRPVLYLDESTLLDPKKNVRGGNPVLFPSP